MIVFEGENSFECKQKAVKKNTRTLALAYFPMFFLVVLFSVVMYLTKVLEIEVAATFFVLGVLMLLLGFLQLFMTARQAGKIFWKRRYEFNENKVIFINYLNGINMIKTDWDIDRIKTIKDEGLYYEIFVKRNKLICEKSLIKEGTIEEFEQRFGDKIKKRKKECQ